MKTICHCKHALTMNYIRLYILTLTVSAVSGAAAVFSLSAAVFIFSVFTFFEVGAALILPKKVKTYRAVLTENGITISSGIVRRGAKLDRNDVCCVQIIQTPLQRRFSACTVILHTMKGSAAVTDIPFDGTRELRRW